MSSGYRGAAKTGVGVMQLVHEGRTLWDQARPETTRTRRSRQPGTTTAGGQIGTGSVGVHQHDRRAIRFLQRCELRMACFHLRVTPSARVATRTPSTARQQTPGRAAAKLVTN